MVDLYNKLKQIPCSTPILPQFRSNQSLPQRIKRKFKHYFSISPYFYTTFSPISTHLPLYLKKERQMKGQGRERFGRCERERLSHSHDRANRGRFRGHQGYRLDNVRSTYRTACR